MPSNDRASIYARITEQIVAAIERGVEVGRMPWHHDGSAIYRPANVGSKKPYRGINTLALWASAEAKGYPTGLWGTFKQWFELGAVVRKGERASAVVLWKQVDHGVVDGGLVNGSARIMRGLGRVGARLQTGQVGVYVLVFVAGAPPDSPAARVDANRPDSPFAGVGSIRVLRAALTKTAPTAPTPPPRAVPVQAVTRLLR